MKAIEGQDWKSEQEKQPKGSMQPLNIVNARDCKFAQSAVEGVVDQESCNDSSNDQQAGNTVKEAQGHGLVGSCARHRNRIFPVQLETVNLF